MNKHIFVAIAFMVSNNALAFQNEPDGFRNFKWDDDISQYEGQMHGENDPNKDMHYYAKDGDQLSIGAANLDAINYFFYKGKFASVMMTATGYSNATALIAAFKEKFGTGYRPNKYIEHYIWRGKVSTVSLDCGVKKARCTALIASTAYMKQDESNRKEMAKDAAKDF